MKRFYYVEAKGGTVTHMAHKRMEGDRTWCGLILRKGWRWAEGGRTRRRCTRCSAAGSGRAT